MLTIGELANKVIDIRNNLDAVEVKGVHNRRLLNTAYDLCDEMLLEFKNTLEALENEQNNKDTPDEVGEIHE